MKSIDMFSCDSQIMDCFIHEPTNQCCDKITKAHLDEACFYWIMEEVVFHWSCRYEYVGLAQLRRT